MKKTVQIMMVMVMFFVTTSTTNAQVKFGIKAGANMSKAYIDKRFFSSDNKVGFLVGPMLDVKIPVLGLGFDLAAQYSYKNMHLYNDDSSETAKMHHIEVPFNVKWTFGNDKVFSVYAATGPQVAWDLGSNSLKEALDLEQYEINKSIFSWNVGAGFTVVRRIRIGYTYNIAIGKTAEIKDKDNLREDIEANIKSNTHQIFLTYFF